MIRVSSRMRSVTQLRFIAPAVLVAFCAVNLSATSQKEVSKFASACRNGDKKACERLTKIASEDKEASIRQLAVQAVADQPSLAEIAIGGNDEETCLQAAKRVSDQTLLTRIALEGRSSKVRSSAATMVVDQQSLTRLVSASNDPAIRAFAQESLDWKAADGAGTGATYTDFLQKYPRTNHLRMETVTLAIGNIKMVANSNSVTAGPNGEIIPNTFRTVVTCEVIKDGRGTGETITLDEAQKRGFLTRNPTTGAVTAVYKEVQRKLYKRPGNATTANWEFVGDLKVLLEPDH
jgi:hypothetical protein